MANVTGQSLMGKSYGVAYFDPPWLYDLYSEKGEEKSAQAQYDCMATDEICRLLKDLLEFSMAPNSVSIMWTTFPMLLRGDAHEVQRAIGFKGKTGGAWGKLNGKGTISIGTGYIYRGSSELWFLGTRGEPRSRVHDASNLLLDPGMLDDGCLDQGMMLDLRREHSRKPDAMIELIERQFPGPYLEIFGREERPGWDVWGNQVGKFGGET